MAAHNPVYEGTMTEFKSSETKDQRYCSVDASINATVTEVPSQEDANGDQNVVHCRDNSRQVHSPQPEKVVRGQFQCLEQRSPGVNGRKLAS